MLHNSQEPLASHVFEPGSGTQMSRPQDGTDEKQLDAEVSEVEMELELDPYFLLEKELEVSETDETDETYLYLLLRKQFESPCSPTEMDSEDPNTPKQPGVSKSSSGPVLSLAVSKAVEPEVQTVPTVPVATPCRSTARVADSTPSTTNSSPPGTHPTYDLEDDSQETPIPGQLRLSQNAIDLRMHRVMKVDSKGNSKVSEEIRKRFHSKKGKLDLQQLFQSCGYNADRGVVVKLFPLFLLH